MDLLELDHEDYKGKVDVIGLPDLTEYFVEPHYISVVALGWSFIVMICWHSKQVLTDFPLNLFITFIF